MLGGGWGWASVSARLTVRGAAGGAVAGAVAHLDPLPAHLQQARVGHARFARVAEALLVVAAVVGDVDGGPGRPGRGLLHVGAGQGVARLVLLQQRDQNKTQIDFPPSAFKTRARLREERRRCQVREEIIASPRRT